MPDPVTVTVIAGAAGGAAGEFVKALWNHAQTRWLASKFAAHLPEAHDQAVANTNAFLFALAQRLKTLEDRLAPGSPGPAPDLAGALEDPDTALTLQAATIASSRTGGEEKRRLLVETVLARLQSTTDSAKAIAANLAVEVIPSLGSEHLEVLGLLGTLLATVDRYSALPPVPSGMGNAALEAEVRNRVDPLIAWFRDCLTGHRIPPTVSDAILIHLGAVGACVLGPRRPGHLHDVLAPAPKAGGYLTMNIFKGSLGTMSLQEPYKSLTTLWDLSLSRLTPTPAGTVVGLAIHDLRTRDSALERWQWGGSDAALLDYPEGEPTYGDRAFNDAVVRAVADQIRRESRR